MEMAGLAPAILLLDMRKAHASAATLCIYGAGENAYINSNPKELIMNVFTKLKKFAANRRAIRELGALDDRALQDLGISRSHIQSAVAGKIR